MNEPLPQPNNTPFSFNSEKFDEFSITPYLNVIKRHWLIFLLSFSGVLTLTAIYVFTREPIYQANGLILVQRQNQAGALAGLGGLGDLSGLTQQSSPLNTQAEIFKSTPVLETTIKELNIKDKKEDRLVSVEDFLKDVSISPIPRTDLMQISYKNPDPEEAIKVTNSLMDNYIQNGVRISRIQKTAARKFIESQLPSARKDFLTNLASLQRFRTDYGLISPEAQTPALVNQIATVRGRIIELTAQLRGLENSQVSLKNLMGSSVIEANDLTTLAQSVGVQQAIVNLQKTQSDLATKTSRYQLNHPEVQALIRQQAAEEKILSDRIAELIGKSSGQTTQSPTQMQRGTADINLFSQQITNAIQINSINEQLITLNNLLRDREQELKSLPKLQESLLTLQLNVESNRTKYTNLLTAFQNAQLSENQDVGNSVIIQSAFLLDKPVSPRILRILLLGGVLGTIVGFAVVWLLEQIDQYLRTEEDISQVYDFTILGSIPNLKQTQSNSVLENSIHIGRSANLVLRNQPRSHSSEAYRMLLTNIRFSMPDNLPKIIAVTSSIPREGKSTTLANLALAMSELNLRVLIVDADMRRPSQHEIWQIPNNFGFSNLLIGSVPLDKIMHSETECIDVITAGEIPPNPIALINSPRFPEFLNQLKEKYDYVLLDCPPVTVATDALLIGRNTDGILLVARPNILTRPAANKLKDSLKQSRQNILGVVINGVQQNNGQEIYYYDSTVEHTKDDSQIKVFQEGIYEKIKKFKT